MGHVKHAVFVICLTVICNNAYGSFFEGEIWEKSTGPTAFVPLPETTAVDLITRIKTHQTLKDLQDYLCHELNINGPEGLTSCNAVPAGHEKGAWEDTDFLRLIFNHYLYENGHYTYEAYETWPAITLYTAQKWPVAAPA